jgi:serine/threonine-protein kinase
VACIDENTLVGYVERRLDERARAAVVAHADECSACHQLIAHAVEALHSTNPDAETLDAAPPLPMELTGWERYQRLERIGSGGCGDVYRAHDPQLNRTVAVKVLRDDGARFLVEAQAQARVEHENVCKVYEVGYVKSRPFIAMQYIDGKTLQALAGELSVEERARILSKVADAIDAAHRLDIIHRDLKPSNIVVERTASGEWKPYVMDFGLARELTESGSTITGTLVGTPLYMAPEQARGEVRSLDRRTDVYGLGATLYAALVGRPPFAGASTVDMLWRVVHEEPTPPRQILATVPRDLETIILKCLDKDPRRRYQTAGALARDLDAFVRGEAVSARPLGFGARLVRRASKHRRLTALGALAIAGVMVSSGVALEARWSAATHARLLRDLGEQTRQIENRLRVAALLPPHNTSAERTQARQRLHAMEEAVTREGRAAVGPGSYALGRGYLALHDDDRALSFLQKAYDAGERDPGLEYALGVAASRVYKRDTDALYTYGHPDGARLPEQREMERIYRRPALAHLRQAAGSQIDSPDYLAALISFGDDQFPEAAQKAHAAFGENDSLYEALELEGEALFQIANQRRADGKRADAIAKLDEAGECYQRAETIARSDDLVYAADCRRLSDVVRVEFELGRPTRASFERGIAVCDRALAVNPDNREAFQFKGTLYVHEAEELPEDLTRCQTLYQQAITVAEESVARFPDDLRSLQTLGRANVRLAECRELHGLDSPELLQRSIKAYQRSMELHSTASALEGIAGGEQALGRGAVRAGKDPRPFFGRAAEAFRRALTHGGGEFGAGKSGLAYTYLGLANLLCDRAEYEASHGIDPGPSLDEAEAVVKKADQDQPGDYAIINTLASVFFDRAHYQSDVGADLSASIEEALKTYQRVIEINPKVFGPYLNLAEAATLKANWLAARGMDATPALDQARKALDAVATPEDGDVLFWIQRCNLELAAARQAAHPEPGIASARSACRRAHQLNAQMIEVLLAEAELYRLLAARAKKPEGEIALGLEAVRAALNLDATSAQARATEGELHVIEMRHLIGAARTSAARKAVDAFDAAFRQNGALRRAHAASLAEAASLFR